MGMPQILAAELFRPLLETQAYSLLRHFATHTKNEEVPVYWMGWQRIAEEISAKELKDPEQSVKNVIRQLVDAGAIVSDGGANRVRRARYALTLDPKWTVEPVGEPGSGQWKKVLRPVPLQLKKPKPEAGSKYPPVVVIQGDISDTGLEDQGDISDTGKGDISDTGLGGISDTGGGLTRGLIEGEGAAGDTVDLPAAGAGNPSPEFIDEKTAAAELPYPDQCSRHQSGIYDRPCRPCGNAREARKQARLAAQQRQADEKQQADADKRNAEREERWRKKRDCTRGCDDNGYLNGWPCSHEPEQAASSNGPAVARAVARGDLTAGDAVAALVLGYGGSDQSKLLGIPPADGPTLEQAAIGNTAAAAMGSLSGVAKTAAENHRRRA